MVCLQKYQNMLRYYSQWSRRQITSSVTTFSSKRFRQFHFQANSILPPLLQKCFYIGDKVAIVDENGAHTYEELALKSLELSKQMMIASKNLEGERIAFLTPNDSTYVISNSATWLNGGISVPLCKTHPAKELAYVLENARPKIVVTTPAHFDMMEELVKPTGAELLNITTDMECVHNEFNVGNPSRDRALIIYTSGTTGPPKGVLWSHSALKSQVDTMVQAWKWRSDDTLLHVLPLHHVHGVVNALFCPLSIGATVVMMNKFSADQVWNHFLGKVESCPDVSVFMAVPTIYAKLLEYQENNLGEMSSVIRERCGKMRLMVSGSSALPSPIFQKWEELTSHALLERYGMTEIGMALTNPYHGKRHRGSVGKPFPGVSSKIINAKNQTVSSGDSAGITEHFPGEQGELLIKGPIFDEYWDNERATTNSFTEDGWFKTGDTATVENDSYRIVGRTSVDIIKSGGYKIGALKIEQYLLEHDNISEVAVLGVPDSVWGERVAAVVRLKNPAKPLSLDDVKAHCELGMPRYSVPTVLKIVDEIPKNAMGKVNKRTLVSIF